MKRRRELGRKRGPFTSSLLLEGTAQRCLAQGCTPYDELPEDPKEKETYYRPKRSDKFKAPESCLFDIADHPWIGAAAPQAMAQ